MDKELAEFIRSHFHVIDVEFAPIHRETTTKETTTKETTTQDDKDDGEKK